MSTSASIEIIPAKVYETRQRSAKAQSPASSSSSTYSSSPQTPSSSDSTSKSAQKRKAIHERRPSLLSSALSHSEARTVNIGDPEGPPRLISYVAAGQGFAWNPEMFLPSYVEVDFEPLQNRREPVVDIIVTEEECRKWLSEDA
ncbi:hypothetical protein N0V82_003894 [Gnomoniopsis sp. IMI 355080]|nr:hypothetical protein N0V82_003894 [Gnomoniopsis sp. IMI 355080]